jgi:hypothetical protein
MNHYKTGGREVVPDDEPSVYDDSDDDEPNEAPFKDIDDEFKNLVQNAKLQLYTAIIESPPITSVEAQDNTLLVKYFKRSNRLYNMCERLYALSDRRLQKKLSTFPLETHESIKQLLDWLKIFYSNNKEVDMIPYRDYLDVQLKRYPCLQKKI